MAKADTTENLPLVVDETREYIAPDAELTSNR